MILIVITDKKGKEIIKLPPFSRVLRLDHNRCVILLNFGLNFCEDSLNKKECEKEAIQTYEKFLHLDIELIKSPEIIVGIIDEDGETLESGSYDCINWITSSDETALVYNQMILEFY